ncbi:hypothetical protein GM50_0205 [freshwater metagenome]|jgi:hypothetical protein|uniref:Uncharacterized protein n=1 Tax=freshwater metagenome TaxID=449393 RepID=A0A094QES6_9ZZZZ
MRGPFTFAGDAIMLCASIYMPVSQSGIGIQDGTNRKEENAEI